MAVMQQGWGARASTSGARSMMTPAAAAAAAARLSPRARSRSPTPSLSPRSSSAASGPASWAQVCSAGAGRCWAPARPFPTRVCIRSPAPCRRAYTPAPAAPLPCPAPATDTGFWDHEWDKHGTCARPVTGDRPSFFNATMRLHERYDLDVSCRRWALPACAPACACCWACCWAPALRALRGKGGPARADARAAPALAAPPAAPALPRAPCRRWRWRVQASCQTTRPSTSRAASSLRLRTHLVWRRCSPASVASCWSCGCVWTWTCRCGAVWRQVEVLQGLGQQAAAGHGCRRCAAWPPPPPRRPQVRMCPPGVVKAERPTCGKTVKLPVGSPVPADCRPYFPPWRAPSGGGPNSVFIRWAADGGSGAALGPGGRGVAAHAPLGSRACCFPGSTRQGSTLPPSPPAPAGWRPARRWQARRRRRSC